MSARIVFDAHWCRTCKVCEVVCSIAKEGQARPHLVRINIYFDEFRVSESIQATVCAQCSEAPCIDSCPVDAMQRDDRTGAVVVNSEVCIGCLKCLRGLPVGRAQEAPRAQRRRQVRPVRGPRRRSALRFDVPAFGQGTKLRTPRLRREDSQMRNFRGGYAGRFLRVDLSARTLTVEPTPDPRKWLGPRGWNALVAWNELQPGVGPFDPQNRIVFSAGPLVGTAAPTAGRTTISSLSPRGFPEPMWTSSSMGGYFGAELKYAGYDGIVVQGAARAPCYLLVEDDRASLEDARDLWGQGTFATQRWLKERHGNQHQVAAIGPAGENRVRFASILHRLSNASGNAGFGGVMGAKNLKAIAVRGTGGVAIADPERFIDIMSYVWNLARGGVSLLGRPEQGYPVVACSHGCSVRCGVRIGFPPGENGSAATPRMLKCQNSAFVRGSHPAYDGVSTRGERLRIPHPPGLGETGMDLGNLIDDRGLTAWFYDTWYRYLGGLRALGMPDLLGAPVDLDDPAWWRDMIARVAYRDGIGDDMAEGLARFYEKQRIGPRYLVEFIESAGSRGHGWHRDGRAMERQPSPFWEHAALLYAVSTRDVSPSTHGFFFLNREYGYPSAPVDPSHIAPSLLELAERIYGSAKAVVPGDDRVEHVTVWHQHRAIIKDSLGLCDFVFPLIQRTQESQDAMDEARRIGGDRFYGDVSAEALMYGACTGLDADIAEMESPIAERIVNLERLVDVRNFGRCREIDETVISHFQWPEKTDSTHLSADAEEFRALLGRYYDLRGWDRQTGIPTPERLRELELVDSAEC